MRRIAFCGYLLLCGIMMVAAQTLNSSETAKLKSFFLQESAEPGKKNYQQLGILDPETVDWKNITGLVWNANGCLDSLKWNNLKLGGELDLSDFTELRFIRCTDNAYLINGYFIDGLLSINVTGCTSLLYFDCYNNSLTSVDVSTNANLEWLCCRWQYVELKTIDLTHNPKLYHFCGTGNKFETIDISKNPELIEFFCAATNLKSLDVSNNKKLKDVYLRGNQLTELVFSNHPELEYLTCYDNQLTKLDVSGCPKLKTLTANNNQLREIKIGYLDMDELACQDNYLTFSTFPKLKSCGNYTYVNQKNIKLLVSSNVVDLSSEYMIDGNLSQFFWSNTESSASVILTEKEGVFTFDQSYKNLICYVINTNFPTVVLTYEIELFSTQSVDMQQDIVVYAVGNMLYLQTNSPLTAEIFTVSGALTQRHTIGGGEYTIPLSKGIYIIKLSNGITRKVVIR